MKKEKLLMPQKNSGPRYTLPRYHESLCNVSKSWHINEMPQTARNSSALSSNCRK